MLFLFLVKVAMFVIRLISPTCYELDVHKNLKQEVNFLRDKRKTKQTSKPFWNKLGKEALIQPFYGLPRMLCSWYDSQCSFQHKQVIASKVVKDQRLNRWS